MKFEKALFGKALVAMFLLVLSGGECHAHKELTADYAAHIDTAVSVGFITCGPGKEVYSLYGHTALHFTDRSRNLDVAVNWGIFDFSKPNFSSRFVFGLTDYTMGICPFELFLREYEADGRWVQEQRLRLTPTEKIRIAEAIDENFRPENREYRYNYFYDNCTTRARDMVVCHLDQPVTYQDARDGGPSFRELIHRFNTQQRWARVGNDMLLGVQADRPTTISEQQFLPVVMADQLDKALVGNQRQLVDTTVMLVTVPSSHMDERPFLQPRECAIVLAVLIVGLTLWEMHRKKSLKWLDVLLMLLCGLGGTVLFLMLFSQHPTVRLNLQILLLNPLPLFFVWPMLKDKCRWQFKLWLVLICLFFVGAIWQTYAEGLMIVASSLLIRNIKHLKDTSKHYIIKKA